MTSVAVAKIIEFIENSKPHTCVGIKCDGNCTRMCGGGGHNTTLVDFYKKRIIDIAYNEYLTIDKIYKTAINSAEERDDIQALEQQVIKTHKHFKNMMELYS